MLNTPFSPWAAFTAEEADAVRDVLLSNQVNYWTSTQGRCRCLWMREFTKYYRRIHSGGVNTQSPRPSAWCLVQRTRRLFELINELV